MSFGGDTNYTTGDFASFCKRIKSRLKYDKTATAVKEVASALLLEFSEEKAQIMKQKCWKNIPISRH